jgi:hypothetical protein
MATDDVRSDLATAIAAQGEGERDALLRLCRDYLELVRDFYNPDSMTALMSRTARRALEQRAEDIRDRAEEAALAARPGPASSEAERRAYAELRARSLGIDEVLDVTQLRRYPSVGPLVQIAELLRLALRGRASLPPELSLMEPLGALASRAAGLPHSLPPPPPQTSSLKSLAEPHRSMALRMSRQLSSDIRTVGSKLLDARELMRYLRGEAQLPTGFVGRVFSRMESLLQLPEGSAERLRVLLTDATQSAATEVAVHNLAPRIFNGVKMRDLDPWQRRRLSEIMGVWRVVALLDLRV